MGSFEANLRKIREGQFRDRAKKLAPVYVEAWRRVNFKDDPPLGKDGHPIDLATYEAHIYPKVRGLRFIDDDERHQFLIVFLEEVEEIFRSESC